MVLESFHAFLRPNTEAVDVDGHDAAHKIGILASLAHGFWVNPRHIHIEGIRGVTNLDMQFADDCSMPSWGMSYGWTVR